MATLETMATVVLAMMGFPKMIIDRGITVVTVRREGLSGTLIGLSDLLIGLNDPLTGILIGLLIRDHLVNTRTKALVHTEDKE